MKRTKKGLALSRETIRALSNHVLAGAAGALGIEESKACSTDPHRCWMSTDLKCPTFGSDCCLASVIIC